MIQGRQCYDNIRQSFDAVTFIIALAPVQKDW